MTEQTDSLDALYDAIEKAAMRFADGTTRRVSMRQRRNIRTQNAISGELRSGKRQMLVGTKIAVSRGPNRRGSGGKAPPSDRLSALRAKRGYKFKFSSTFGRKGYGGVRKSDPISKAKPKTLYVFRPVLNAEYIIAWAKAQGFGSTLEAGDMHATIAFSKTPLNWAKLGDDWCAEDPRPGEGDERRYAEAVSWSEGGRKQRKIEGGAREVKALGDKGAVVLAFQSPSLTERWAQFIRIGASWDYAGYTPHITITYKGGSIDLSKVEPYRGPIILGEEDWNEIKEGAGDDVPETLAAVEKAQAEPAKEAA